MTYEDGKKNVGTIAIVGGHSSLRVDIARVLMSIVGATASEVERVKTNMVEEVAFAKTDHMVVPPYVKPERAGKSNHNYSADRRRAKKNRRSK